MSKIEYVIEDFSQLSADAGAWLKEHTQRNAIVRGLDNAAPSDLVIVSDLDEIPKRDAVVVLRHCAGICLRTSYAMPSAERRVNVVRQATSCPPF